MKIDITNILIRSQVGRKLVLSESQVEHKNTSEIAGESLDDKPSRSTGFAFADHFSVFLEFPHQHLNLIAVKTRQNLLQFFERSTDFIVLPDVLTEFYNQKVALLSRVSFLCFQSGISIVRNA